MAQEGVARAGLEGGGGGLETPRVQVFPHTAGSMLGAAEGLRAGTLGVLGARM